MGRLASITRAAIDRIISFALPPRCPGCGEVTLNDHDFCLACWTALDFLGDPQCVRCGEPFELDPGPEALCGACHADPPVIDGLRAAVRYGPIARRIALRLKHGRRPGFAHVMARHMRRHFAPLSADPEAALLVPIPLHRWRIWRRGYNQAALIARALGRIAPYPIAIDMIERHKRTPILRAMGPRARAMAVRGAFRLRPGAAVKGRHIILIDDVYTTGATVNACAKLLKRAGAARVSVLCWARVVRDDAGIR